MSLVLRFEDITHHRSVVIMLVLHQPENVSEKCEADPSPDTDRLPWLSDPPDMGQRWLLVVMRRHERDAGHVTSFWLFTFLLLQRWSAVWTSVGLGLANGHAGEDSLNSLHYLTSRCCCAFTAFTWGSCQLCSSCSPKSAFYFFYFISFTAVVW